MESLSQAQARRIALAAQGLAKPRPTARVGARQLRALFARTQLIQIDSVNVLTRAHYLPAWSRLGGYDRTALDRLAFKDRALFEYWGHEASLIPMALHPLFRWRMTRAEEKFETWGRVAQLGRERPGYVEHVLQTVRDRGPITAGELASEEQRRTDDWGWNWTDAKTALEFLFWCGRITTATRRNFERHYDITERVIPSQVLDLPTPSEEQAHRELLILAAQACGVGTVGDLADYFRIKNPQARPRVAELVEDGRLVPVTVDGWREPAYVLPDPRLPRTAGARAVLVPFDPLIWSRPRVERLFRFRYRVEIYVPPAKRVHGYYVLPFLFGDTLAARVDLKSDRAAGVLRVQAAWAEPAAPADTADALAAELAELAAWLGLERVAVTRRGDLARALSAAAGHEASNGVNRAADGRIGT